MAAGGRVMLTNGARASRVFWQVNGAAGIGANAHLAETLMALDAIAVGAGTRGQRPRAGSNGAISLDANEVYSAPPAVAIAGGASAFTTDTTPTDRWHHRRRGAGGVTVTIAGQIFAAILAAGGWSVTSAILANATYPMVASVRTGRELGSATQDLTVDTVLPLVTIDGGASVTTNDPSPTSPGPAIGAGHGRSRDPRPADMDRAGAGRSRGTPPLPR